MILGSCYIPIMPLLQGGGVLLIYHGEMSILRGLRLMRWRIGVLARLIDCLHMSVPCFSHGFRV